MKDLNAIQDWSDKQLRTLRNNLNNRLESFKKDGEPRALQASNVLHGKSEKQCQDLLKKVKELMAAKAR